MELKPRLQNEVLLFRRLMYKARNQHHTSIHYKKLQLVKRILCRNNDYIHQEIVKVIDAIKEAYIFTKAVAKSTYFMSVNLAFMASLARMSVLLRQLVMETDKPLISTATCANTLNDILVEESQDIDSNTDTDIKNESLSILSECFFAPSSKLVNHAKVESDAVMSDSSESMASKEITSKEIQLPSMDDIFADFI